MNSNNMSPEGKLRAENAALRARLEEAEETVRAIRTGEVDSLVVETSNGPKLFSLQAEETIARHVEELDALYATAPTGLFQFDADLRFVRVNEWTAAINGRSIEAHLGRTAGEVLGPELARHTERTLRQVLETGEPVREIEVHGTTSAHTEERDWLASYYPMRCADGDVVGVHGVVQDITARKRAERDFRLRDRAIAASDAGVFIVDPYLPDFPIVFASEGYERMTGYTAAEALGRNCRFLQGGDTDAATVARLHEAVNTHTPIRVTLLNYRKNGTPFWNDLSISPVTDPQGRVTHLVGIQNDVSTHLQLQSSLEASRDRLTIGAAVAGFALAEIDYTTGINRLTAAAARAFGLGETEMDVPRGRVHATFHPDDGEELSRRIAASLDPAGPAEFAMDHRVIWPDGEVRWLTVRKQVFFTGESSSRRPHRAILAILDVTEEKLAGAELRASHTRIQLASEATSIGIWEWDLLANTIRWDTQMFRLYGIAPTPDSVVQYTDWSGQVLPEDRPESARFLQDTLCRLGRSRREFRIRRRSDGEVRHIESMETVLVDERGQAEKVLGTTLDITERKHAEVKLRDLAAALSEVDRRKDEFLATLAHELRNPLAPIRNGLQLMKLTGGESATFEQTRAMIERQVAQMVRLVDDLMDVSRISRGTIELRKERIPLAAVLNNALESCGPVIEQMGHAVTLTLPKQPLIVDADMTRLAQVFANLLNNAAKYSGQGGRIQLNVEHHGSDGVVTVKDTGLGIAAEDLPHIFEMFSQANRSLHKAEGGLGIGLTLVKRLVEMHGGRVEAKSDGIGKGSEFIVRLPVLDEATKLQTAGGEAEHTVTSSHCILVVDDNRDSADSLAMMLRIMGNDTHTAYDGQEAVHVAWELQPDVIMLDIGLPKLNGYEACRLIRDQSGGRGVVLIALTGWGQDEDRRRAKEAGFDHHMVKPVEPQALMKILAGLQHDEQF